MRIILTLTLSVILTQSVLGQTVLQYGDNHMSRINTLGEVDQYEFKADSGDIIWIRMRDVTKVDAYFKLYNPVGGLVAQDSDDGGLAFIKDLTLHQTGIYRIEAFDWHHNDIGDYGIALHQINHPNYAEPIPCSINFTDEINVPCAIKVYSFQGTEGAELYTQMRGLTVHIEPEYFLYDEMGNLIFKSYRQGRMAKYALPIPHTGTYYLYVMDKGGNDSDLFGFNLQYLNLHDCSHTLHCGQTVSADIEHMAARNPYVLEMQAGEKGLLQMRSPDPGIEISFAVYDQQGQIVVEKSGSDKMIDVELEASSDATYLIVVFDQHGNDLGPYRMHYESITHNPCSQEILCESSNYFEDYLSGVAEIKSYHINGHKGDAFHFHLEELDSPLEPYLRMYDAAGTLLIEAHGSKRVQIDGIFDADGAYYILIGDKSGNDFGGFTFLSESSTSTINLPETLVVDSEQPCVTVLPEITGVVHDYLWSDGSTASDLAICPQGDLDLHLTATFANGCTAEASTKIIFEKSACDTITFNDFLTGEIPGSKLGFVQISAQSNHQNGTNLAAVFNSTDPPKHSEGLGTPHNDFGGAGIGGGGAINHRGENNQHQYQVLVLAENDTDKDNDGLLDNPVDDPKGGSFLFEFQAQVDITSILVIDQHQEGGNVEVYGQTDQLLGRYEFETLGNNSVETVRINTEGVKKMKVEFIKWGALDDIVYCERGITKNGLSDEAAKSGKFDLGRIIRPSSVSEFESTTIFPNPSQERFNILFNKTLPTTQLTLFDLSGRLILEKNILTPSAAQIEEVEVHHLPPGLYMLKIATENRSQFHKIQIVN